MVSTDLQEVGVEAAVESHHHADSAARDFLVSGLHFFDGKVNGLFAEDLFSARGGIHDHLVMQIGGAADRHRVHFGKVQQLSVVPECFPDSVPGGNRLQFRGGDVTDGHHFGPGNSIHQVFDVNLADAADSQNAKAKLASFHPNTSLCPSFMVDEI